VYDEIVINIDPLTAWLKRNLPRELFIDTTLDSSVVAKYQDVSDWVIASDRYNATAKRRFLEAAEADPWICAFARINNLTVVTEERGYSTPKKVSLPDVIDAFGVAHINLFEFLEIQQAQFVLA